MERLLLPSKIWRYVVSDGVPKRSFIVAVIVGTILNLINQGDAVLTGKPIDITKLLLTYLVPYCVSTYGAVSYRLHAARPGPRGPASGRQGNPAACVQKCWRNAQWQSHKSR
jgi:hypothetical protein